jgi:hypothetical protein
MIQVLDKKHTSDISPDFIYNRFDLFCDNYIILMAEYGQEKHVVEVRIFNNYAELGVWKMHISNELLKEISDFLFHKYSHIGYVKFFFCKTTGNYKEVKHFSIDFPDSTDVFLQRRSSKSRHRLNKQRHQAEREVGPITYKEFKKENCPDDIIKYYNIWKKRTHNIGEIEAQSYFQKFHVSDIYVLYLGNNIAAMMFSCEQCPIAYLENFSFDIQYSRYSPGQQIYEYVMTRLIDKKFKRVFLAGGDYDYKRYYGSIEEKLYDGLIFRNTLHWMKYNIITYYNKHLYWKVKNIKSKL